MNCNFEDVLLGGAGRFQSLIGILVNCNFINASIAKGDVFVSIPNRDFGELQSQ